jgi:hypothetical protein
MPHTVTARIHEDEWISFLLIAALFQRDSLQVIKLRLHHSIPQIDKCYGAWVSCKVNNVTIDLFAQ